MRILSIVPNIHPSAGGPAYTVPSLNQALSERGHDVTQVSVFDVRVVKNKSKGNFQSIHVPGVVSHAKNIVWSPFLHSFLKYFCSIKRPDIVHNNGLWTPVNHTAAVISRQLNIPFVNTPRGMMTQWSWQHSAGKKKLAYQLYQKKDLRHTNLFHATATPEAEDIRKLSFSQPICVIPNGLELPEKRIRQGRIAKTSRTLLFMSRVHPKKGLETLIDAWHRVRPTGWKCKIVGPATPQYLAALKKQVAQHCLSSQFEFSDFLSGELKWDALFEADLFVLPTRSENFGVVVAEALAAETPVITTFGAPWSQLQSHKCGWWIPDDVDNLSKTLSEAIALSDDTRAEMGRRGRVLVESAFSWSAISLQMEEVYQWLLQPDLPIPDSFF